MTLILSGTDGLSDIDGSAATPAIRGTDANTGIFFPAADTIGFSEGGAEAMRINSSGNVGIGTSSPVNKVTVNGGVSLLPYYETYLANSYYSGSWKYAGNGHAWGIGNNFGGPANGATIAIAAVNAGGAGAALTWNPAFNIDSSGNVGIGTSSPTSLLHVSSTTANPQIKITDLSIAGGRGGSIQGSYGGNGLYLDSLAAAGWVYIGSSTGGGQATNIRFDTSNAERMRIDSSGNVMMGTTTSNSIRLSVDSGAANFGSAQIKGSGTLPDNNDNSVLYVNHAGTAGTGLRVRTDQALTGTNFAHILVNNASASINGLQVSQYGTGYIASFDKSGTVAMRIDSSGNVIVGGTSTSSDESTYQGGGVFVSRRASSAGTTHANFLNGGSTVGSITSNTTATFYNTTSDYRLKNTIAPMTGALDKVALLKPCTYKWNVDGSDGQGFIAHELQEVIAGCVTGEKDAVETYTDEDGNEATRPVHQGIDTSFLVATLTAAIQEQQALITALTARIEALENK